MSQSSSIPLWYRLFCLYIEPVSTILGAIYAHFFPHIYLSLTSEHLATSPLPLAAASAVPVETRIVLSQLANLYFAFTLNEALVLRCTSDVRVWRTLLFGLLVADFGHVLTVHPAGASLYWEVWRWNSIDWGNLGFVYLGAATRICFLLGIGLEKIGKDVKKL